MSRRKHVDGWLKASLCFLVAVPLLWSLPGIASAGQDGRVLASLFGSESKLGPAADFELPDLNGTLIKLSKYKGDRPVLVYFWATWCPYCISVKPEIKKIREKMEPKELEILAINVGGGDSLDRLKKYQEGHPVSWPVLYDANGSVTRTYQVQGIPLFVLVDKGGNVVYRDNALPPDIMKLLK